MNRPRKTWLILGTGWGFILMGIAGLLLPLPGLLFLAMGLIVLSGEYIWARKLRSRLTARFPKLAAPMEQASARTEGWFGRSRTDTQG